MLQRRPVSSPFSSTRAICGSIPTTLAFAGLLLSAVSQAADSRGELARFLAGQIAPEVLEFGQIRMTRSDISSWLTKLRTTQRPQPRGIAVANLQNCAWVLLDVPAAKPAALELLDQWVLPNATLLRTLPRSSACSWENVMMGAYASYRKASDVHGERRVLELLSTQARDPGLRDLAILRLAGQKADQGSLKEAIDIARKTDSRGEFAEDRARLLEYWQHEAQTQQGALMRVASLIAFLIGIVLSTQISTLFGQDMSGLVVDVSEMADGSISQARLEAARQAESGGLPFRSFRQGETQNVFRTIHPSRTSRGKEGTIFVRTRNVLGRRLQCDR